MRLLVSWVRDFVDVAASPEEIAEKLSMRGFEVASIEPMPGGDAVIDFEVTANRPDCLSVLGFAREIATMYELPVHLPVDLPSSESGAKIALRSTAAGDSERLKVSVEDTELCPRYAAAIADVTPGASPAWLTSRLQAAGVRPISPIVDITNYVLIELGHPLHAFDLAKLAGAELRIRRAKRGEIITTLDGVERKLEPEMLVIADANRAQAIAGVMGGAASEVSQATTVVAFESAYFKPASVRRTSKRLGLKTEASSRFERGADVSVPVVALERAIALMERLGAGRMSGPIVDRYPHVRQPAQLHLRRARLARLLGTEVADREVERILRHLGLGVTATPDGWDVIAPTFRVDLSREVDLIEEVGRHHGFDALAPTFPAQTAPAPPPAPSPQATTPSPTGEGAPATAPTLTGALAFLDGTPIAGAAIAVQARTVSRKGEAVREQTLAEVATDAQGQFSLPASFANVPAGRMWLRALCAGSSAFAAAVSDPLHVSVGAPLLSPPAAAAPSAPGAAPPAS